MPYPSQINREQIVEAARGFIQKESVDALTLSKLGSKLGVKAPSLYRHVANKEALLQAVNLQTMQELFAQLSEAHSEDAAPQEQLLALATAFRSFAHASPDLYILAMTTKPEEGRPAQDTLTQMARPIQSLMAQLSGEENSLTALRGLFALIHGFVMLELNQQLQRGGELDQVFEEVAKVYLNGWQ